MFLIMHAYLFLFLASPHAIGNASLACGYQHEYRVIASLYLISTLLLTESVHLNLPCMNADKHRGSASPCSRASMANNGLRCTNCVFSVRSKNSFKSEAIEESNLVRVFEAL